MKKLLPIFWTLFVIVGAAVMIALGFWQLSRLGERRALNAEIKSHLDQPPLTITGEALDTSALEYRRATVTGAFDFPQEILLRNRSKSEITGVHLLTPLKIEGSDKAVLVDRGWIAYTASDPQTRTAYAGPTGLVALTGVVRLSQSRPSTLAPYDPPLGPDLPRLDAWFWIDIPRIQQQVPYPLLPFFIEQDAGPDPTTLPAPGWEVELNDGPHLSYAVQWFSFATVLVTGSIALARRNVKRQTSKLKMSFDV
ncbi:MAG: SURF1 family protein [Chloroflexi bacterium]|nr:SURF1 family protein [Chloroflexota bacterium]